MYGECIYFTMNRTACPYFSGNIMNILAIYPIIQHCKKQASAKVQRLIFYTVLLVILAVSYMVCFILRKRGPHHGKTKESTASF